jgi:hypothetical protein
VNAFATRARVTALGNAAHLVDTQTVYSNPADMMVMGDYVNFESGTTVGGAENANAEGMITRSMGESKLGLALGHQSSNASIWRLRSTAFTGFATTKSQQNPVNLSYGMKMNDMQIAGTVVYSNYNNKVTNEKESSSGLRFGMRSGAWDAKLGIGLGNTYENATDGKFTGTAGYSGGVGYMMDDMYLNAFIEMAGFKTENTAGVEQRKFDGTSITLNALKSIKKDGNEIFYGIGLSQTNTKTNITAGTIEQKTTAMSLPITIGMEADAASWLTLRGSVTQSTIISNSKTENNGTATAETAPGLNTTTAAVGAGLKFNKLTVDGTLKGLTGGTATQDINGNNLLAQVGFTYMF